MAIVTSKRRWDCLRLHYTVQDPSAVSVVFSFTLLSVSARHRNFAKIAFQPSNVLRWTAGRLSDSYHFDLTLNNMNPTKNTLPRHYTLGRHQKNGHTISNIPYFSNCSHFSKHRYSPPPSKSCMGCFSRSRWLELQTISALVQECLTSAMWHCPRVHDQTKV